MLSPIGDTLFATPVIHALRQRYPKAHLAAVAFPTNMGVLEDNPDIDELLIHPTLFPLKRTLRVFSLLWTLWLRRFDLTVDLCSFSIFLPWVIGHGGRWVKLRLPPFWWLRPHLHSDWSRTHAVHHFLRVVEPLGLSVPQPKLHLTLTEGECRFAENVLTEQGLGAGDLVISIHPGGEGMRGRKKWGRKRFVQVGLELVRRHGAKLVILGGPDDVATARWVAQAIGKGCFSLAGRTTLKQTAALIQRSTLFIGNDSSPLHLATAVGTPVVGIYGPSNLDNWHPFGANSVVVRREVPCAPCFHYVGTTPLWMGPWCRRCRALEELSASEVVQAAEALLRVGAKAGG